MGHEHEHRSVDPASSRRPGPRGARHAETVRLVRRLWPVRNGAETAGGLLLALGLATPVAAAMLIAVMVVAAVSAHLKHGFFAHNQGYEYTLVLATAALTIAFTGPGPISLDALLGLHDGGYGWGLGSLALGLAGGAMPLANRRVAAPQKVNSAT